jgi:flagellum-specific peptidoglycan hydrolase FlgJ
MTPAQLEALGRIAEAAVAAERKPGCLAAISAAQCLVESAWLQVAPGNNCLGIKAKADDHCQYCLTKDYLNGEWTSQKLAFATYPSVWRSASPRTRDGFSVACTRRPGCTTRGTLA